jgi:hypothetical protein
MVENVRFVNVRLLTRKLGVTEIRIVPSMFVRIAFLRSGFRLGVNHHKLLNAKNVIRY